MRGAATSNLYAAWVRRHAARDHTGAEFARINAVGFVSTLAATGAFARGRQGRFAHYTLVLTQQAIWKPVFHASATFAWGEYSPGLVTSIVLFLPLRALTTPRAVKAGHLGPRKITSESRSATRFTPRQSQTRRSYLRQRCAARKEDRT